VVPFRILAGILGGLGEFIPKIVRQLIRNLRVKVQNLPDLILHPARFLDPREVEKHFAPLLKNRPAPSSAGRRNPGLSHFRVFSLALSVTFVVKSRLSDGSDRSHHFSGCLEFTEAKG
jgi:hypothetical protein